MDACSLRQTPHSVFMFWANWSGKRNTERPGGEEERGGEGCTVLSAPNHPGSGGRVGCQVLPGESVGLKGSRVTCAELVGLACREAKRMPSVPAERRRCIGRDLVAILYEESGTVVLAC